MTEDQNSTDQGTVLKISTGQQENRFSRFELIRWWDQSRLQNARVLVIGAGALGNELSKIWPWSESATFCSLISTRSSLRIFRARCFFVSLTAGATRPMSLPNAHANYFPKSISDRCV